MTPILVTGASRGLGAEICRHLAHAGHPLLIHYRRSKKEAKELVEECRAQGIEAEMVYGELSTQESLNHFISHLLADFPEIKGLVNNVGNFLTAPLLQTELSQWQELFQVNFFAPLQLTKAFLPTLKKYRGGILNIGVSGLHSGRGAIKTTAYTATKSALLFYTLSLAKELMADEVRVNMLSPGYMENTVDLPKAPLKRMATLAEVARVAAFLFDPQSSYITGQNIEVAGGYGL